jgi:UPF0755 protein
MWKHIASNVLTLMIVGVIALAGLIGWGQSVYVSEGPLEEAVFFEVQRGASLTSVSENLEAAGAIQSGTIFRLAARYAERDGDLKFGNYEIPARATMPEILDIVTAGGPSTFRYTSTFIIRSQGAETRVRERVPGQEELAEVATFAAGEPLPEAYARLVEANTPMIYRVSIAEGLTSWEITEGLKAAHFLSGEIEGLPVEGSLAPDTYEVTRGTDRGALVGLMAASQERILAAAWENRQEDIPVSSPEEAMILASIIEKETSVPEERGLVASVFTNRLRQGMRLQTDPTVIYGITNGRGVLGRGLRRSELQASTPYNTYVIAALPPTPIANPGRAAIEAAVNPDQSPYIFFVADGTGGHAFSVTLAEHNQNVARWRQIERERANSQN